MKVVVRDSFSHTYTFEAEGISFASVAGERHVTVKRDGVDGTPIAYFPDAVAAYEIPDDVTVKA